MALYRQMIIKVYPHTYTSDSFNKLIQLLEKGWLVHSTILSFEDKSGGKIYDYILQR